MKVKELNKIKKFSDKQYSTTDNEDQKQENMKENVKDWKNKDLPNIKENSIVNK